MVQRRLLGIVLLLAMVVVGLPGLAGAQALAMSYSGELVVSSQNVVLAATLSGKGVRGTAVEFYLDDVHVGTATANPKGVAVLSIGEYEPGEYEVRAEAGDLSACATLRVYEYRVTADGEIRSGSLRIAFAVAGHTAGWNGWIRQERCEVTFHKVSDPNISGGTFYGTELWGIGWSQMDGASWKGGLLEFVGTFNGHTASLYVRVSDSAEKGRKDAIHLYLHVQGEDLGYTSDDYFYSSGADFAANHDFCEWDWLTDSPLMGTFLQRGSVTVDYRPLESE